VSLPEVIHILIADDHPVFREGLCALIARRPDMQVVAEASDGKEAVELFLRHQPDIALIDLRMAKIGGLEAILAIRRQTPEARIIVLTTFGSTEEVYRSIQAGVKGFLLKDAPREQLLECIRTVHAGGTFIPSDIAAKLAERLSAPELTPRELEVLRLLVDGKSNKEIGGVMDISEGTVKVHVIHILEKLQVSGRAAAITAALERGIVLHP
jgi:DNA-binding NarL/FixJ family response regulator